MRELAGREPDEKLTAKIARKLDARGFSGGDIIKLLSELKDKWKEETQEQ